MHASKRPPQIHIGSTADGRVEIKCDGVVNISVDEFLQWINYLSHVGLDIMKGKGASGNRLVTKSGLVV